MIELCLCSLLFGFRIFGNLLFFTMFYLSSKFYDRRSFLPPFYSQLPGLKVIYILLMSFPIEHCALGFFRLGNELADLFILLSFLGPKKSLGSFLEILILVSAVLNLLIGEKEGRSRFGENLLSI